MHILLVQKEKTVANFIKKGVEAAKFTVDIVADGDSAASLLSTMTFDLILLDMRLPQNGGKKLLQLAKEAGLDIPILCMTEKEAVSELVSALDSGCDGCIAMPFALPVLMARIRALFRRREMNRGTELRLADLRLDPVTHKVWRAEKLLKLTSKEYALLEYLMRNPNQPLTRELITENVWEDRAGSWSNYVEVYINFLRKKIDRGFDSKLIHTVPGTGYVLREA